MNNNQRGNNRRRGRGTNRPQGGGRGEQLNRVDSRARGNAPQLLEKYKKMASDAHLNGDRVQAEYYLQFADHYFRVLADARLRQEEQRRPRDDRFGDGEGQGDGQGYEGDDGDDGDFSSFDQPTGARRDEPRDIRTEPRDYRAEQREYRGEPPEEAVEPGQGGEAENEFEPAGANPFTRDNREVRDNRASRGLRPRSEGRGEGRAERSGNRAPPVERDDDNAGGLDPSILPPAISDARDASDAGDEAAAPKRRVRRPSPPAEDAGSEPAEVTGR